MNRFIKPTVIAVVALVAAIAALSFPVFAQTPEGEAMPIAGSAANTITVAGYGTATGSPDMAAVDVGVETFSPNVSEAFAESNTTVEAVVNALVELGIAEEDVRTSNLNVYAGSRFDSAASMEGGSGEQQGYFVSNTVHIVVRDISQIEAVIDTALGAGANTLYGLNFSFSDTTALQNEARQTAMEDARTRAEQYASLIGATLGDVVQVAEGAPVNGIPYAEVMQSDMGRGGAGAFVTPGQSEISIGVTVVFSFTR
jgi:uncharacterized protein YggE